MKNGFLQRIFIRNAFKKFNDRNTVDEILNGNIKIEDKPEEKECGYIIIEIIQNNEFESTLSNLLEYSKNKNLVYDIYGIIFLLYVSKVLWNKNKEINIKDILDDFIENMPENINKNIRCVYGVEYAKIGIFKKQKFSI